MEPSPPHYLLFSQSPGGPCGAWKFELLSVNGPERLEVADQEPGVRGQRLELLTVIRGLEALDQPSRVTLMTPSRYVREGIRYGVSEWRGNGWRWESYGEMVPVKNRDLWQRIDRAMRFHQVECRIWRVDPAHAATAQLSGRSPGFQEEGGPDSGDGRPGAAGWWRRPLSWGRRAVGMIRGRQGGSARRMATLVAGL